MAGAWSVTGWEYAAGTSRRRLFFCLWGTAKCSSSKCACPGLLKSSSWRCTETFGVKREATSRMERPATTMAEAMGQVAILRKRCPNLTRPDARHFLPKRRTARRAVSGTAMAERVRAKTAKAAETRRGAELRGLTIHGHCSPRLYVCLSGWGASPANIVSSDSLSTRHSVVLRWRFFSLCLLIPVLCFSRTVADGGGPETTVNSTHFRLLGIRTFVNLQLPRDASRATVERYKLPSRSTTGAGRSMFPRL
mmetsp:Transcript_36915/g.118328  ORF Transcript_36915/g.118328 Transcript_36915/m.118328 type:complete len:251 (+) Transcript_36915:3371-4123(+)